MFHFRNIRNSGELAASNEQKGAGVVSKAPTVQAYFPHAQGQEPQGSSHVDASS